MKAGKISLLVLFIVSTLHVQANPSFKIVDGISNAATREVMEKNVNELITIINGAYVAKQKKLNLSQVAFISPVVKETLEKMWASSSMQFPDAEIKASCLQLKTGNLKTKGYQVRGLPFDISLAEDGEQRQELTIDFSLMGKIENVAVAIDIHRYDAIMKKKITSELDYARKQAVLNFVEDFRTAYNKKDIDLIESVFSSDALIITGRVITRATSKDLARNHMGNHVDVEYDVLNKKDYITKLRGIFKKNKFVNVKFSDIQVVRVPTRKDREIYGVLLKQDWRTSRYSDEGLLFLKVDFADKDFPMIQVRVWKPLRDGNGNIIVTDANEDFAKFITDTEI